MVGIRHQHHPCASSEQPRPRCSVWPGGSSPRHCLPSPLLTPSLLLSFHLRVILLSSLSACCLSFCSSGCLRYTRHLPPVCAVAQPGLIAHYHYHTPGWKIMFSTTFYRFAILHRSGFTSSCHRKQRQPGKDQVSVLHPDRWLWLDVRIEQTTEVELW